MVGLLLLLPLLVSGANGPAVSSLNPSSIAAGYPFPSLTLTVTGSGFVNGSIVRWNATPLASTYVSPSQLTALVPASLIASPGTAMVSVIAGGVASNALNFTIGPPNPTIASLNPDPVIAGSGATSLTVRGTGFAQGATVHAGNTALSTNYIDQTQLTAIMPASLTSNPGSILVQVTNLDGGLSNIYALTVSTPPKLSILTSSPLQSGTVGVPYTLALAATGGTTPYKGWTVVGGAIPPGLSLTNLSGVPNGAVLSGVPTASGSFMFTAQVMDYTNTTATGQLSLVIGPPAPSISLNGILNAASFSGGGVAPGEMITIFGTGLGPGTLAGLQLDSRGYVSTSLAGTQVFFDGAAAPLIYTIAGQVSAMVPYETAGKSSTRVQAMYQGIGSNIVSVPVLAVMPGIFTLDSSGHGPGAIINQNGTVNSASNPATPDSIVFAYATGEGQTDPAGTNGKANGSPAPVPLAQPVTATIGGLDAPVVYAGAVPGMVAGVLQVNLRVPTGLAPGSALPVVIAVAGKNSQANVTMTVGPAAQ